MEENFTNYLKEVGIIDNKSENLILSLYKIKYYNYLNYDIDKIKFNEIMTEILIDFFNNLTQIQKKYICFHLPVKFLKLKKNLLQQKLKNILVKVYLKNKFILSKYLFRWFKNIHANKNIKSGFNNINTNNNSKNNKMSKISKYIEEYLLINNIINNKNDNKKKLKQLELENDKDIYFNLKKEIRSKTYNNSKDKNNFFNNLYDNNNNYFKNKNNKNKKINNNKKLININDYTYDNIFNKKSINISTLNETYYNYLPTNANNSNIIYNNNSENKDLNTMHSYNMKKNFKNNREYKPKTFLNSNHTKEKNINNIKYQNYFEENTKTNNTISPVIKIRKRNNNNINNKFLYFTNKNILNNNYIKTYYSNIFNPTNSENIKKSIENDRVDIYNRLFEDGKNRIRKNKQKKLEQEKYLDDLSNQIGGDRKKVDYGKINNLYNDKERNKTYEKTKLKVETEEGLTFTPLVNDSKYIKRIYSNFMERNYYNKKYLNEYNNMHNYKYNNNNLKTRKKISKKQKDKIINKIINKLNMNSLMKNMSSSCNKYTKEINSNSSHRKVKL